MHNSCAPCVHQVCNAQIQPPKVPGPIFNWTDLASGASALMLLHLRNYGIKHARTHIYIHLEHTHIYTQMHHTHTCTCMDVHTNTYTQAQSRAFEHTRTHMYGGTHIHIHEAAQSRTSAHTHPNIQFDGHPRRLTITHSYIFSRTHACMQFAHLC